MINFGDLIEKFIPQFKKWVSTHVFHLALFNIILMVLVLLRSAGYFQPFIPITVHMIVLITLILLISVLGVRSNFLFSLTCLLWLFAAFLRLMGIDVWAERTVIYAFEALTTGIVLLIIESWKDKK